jgi:hypothetical protein
MESTFVILVSGTGEDPHLWHFAYLLIDYLRVLSVTYCTA